MYGRSLQQKSPQELLSYFSILPNCCDRFLDPMLYQQFEGGGWFRKPVRPEMFPFMSTGQLVVRLLAGHRLSQAGKRRTVGTLLCSAQLASCIGGRATISTMERMAAARLRGPYFAIEAKLRQPPKQPNDSKKGCKQLGTGASSAREDSSPRAAQP